VRSASESRIIRFLATAGFQFSEFLFVAAKTGRWIACWFLNLFASTQRLGFFTGFRVIESVARGFALFQPSLIGGLRLRSEFFLQRMLLLTTAPCIP
jgi:hypothetical protein